MFYLIGLGLSDETDITVKGLEIVKRAARVYLEHYTSILLVDKEKLESYYGRSIVLADREMVESRSDEILADADTTDVAFLVVGDPFGATTHSDLMVRCRQHSPQIPARTIANASIMNAVGATGLQLYSFGQTVSMVFFTESWRPDSWYDRIGENARLGLHTLVLLDIKVKEPDLDVLARTGRTQYLPPRFMSVAQCAAQMLEVEEKRGDGVCGPERLGVGVARLGSVDQTIKVGTLEQLSHADLGAPLHSLVLVGSRAHEMEREMLEEWAIDRDSFNAVWKRDYAGKK